MIQRPCSAIKELLENSLDAGATSISITVQEGGFKAFTIQDNGHGILVPAMPSRSDPTLLLTLQREDLPLLCERYATSKLRRLEDLREIGTFGFRGEALASISHVARLSLLTRTADSPVGFRASFLDGKMVGLPETVAANPGTILTVQDLFYNNPVRSAAMATSPAARSEEYARIVEVVQRYAIARAGSCAFSCRKTSGTADLVTRLPQTPLDVIRAIHGDKIASALLPLADTDGSESGSGSFSGLVSNAYYQGKSFLFILFINGRLVESARLRRALAAVYSQLLLKGTHPFCYLSLRLPGDRVDVNVHPTKREVIFLDEDCVIEKITRALRSVLAQTGIVAPSPLPHPLPLPASVPMATLQSAREVRVETSALQLADPSAKGVPTKPHHHYPFEQIHTDPRTRTLDFFVHKRARLLQTSSHPPAIANFTSDHQATPTTAVTINSHDHSTSDPTLVDDNPFLQRTIDQQSTLPARETTDRLAGLRADSVRVGSKRVNELLQKHTFVGLLDERQAFIQFECSLLLIDVPRVLASFLYISLLHCDPTRQHRKRLSPAKSVAGCLRAFFDVQAAALLDAIPNVSREALYAEICTLYCTNVRPRKALEGLLAMELLDGPSITSIYDPLAIAGGDDARLGEFLFRVVMDIEWEDVTTAEPTEQLYQLYCEYLVGHLSNVDGPPDAERRMLYEHTLLDALRRPPSGALLPEILLSNGAILQVATTRELYKIFERC